MDFLQIFAFGFFFLMMVILFVVLPLVRKKRSQVFLDHFHARFLFPLGTIVFSFLGFNFRIHRIAQGGGYLDSLRSFLVLLTYLKPCPRFILGSTRMKNYCPGSFLSLPSIEMSIEGIDLYVGCEDKNKLLMFDKKIAQEVVSLFQKDFAHILITPEWHVGGATFFQKKYVLKYICLSEEINQNPKLLESDLEKIVSLAQKMSFASEI